jgi:hypothetical protein
VAKTLNERISKYGQVVLQTLAYAGTGDVLQIQSLLATCGEHIEVEENAGWKVSYPLCIHPAFDRGQTKVPGVPRYLARTVWGCI